MNFFKKKYVIKSFKKTKYIYKVNIKLIFSFFRLKNNLLFNKWFYYPQFVINLKIKRILKFFLTYYYFCLNCRIFCLKISYWVRKSLILIYISKYRLKSISKVLSFFEIKNVYDFSKIIGNKKLIKFSCFSD